MYESIYKNNELENEVSSDMSYFWYSDGCTMPQLIDKVAWASHKSSPCYCAKCPAGSL